MKMLRPYYERIMEEVKDEEVKGGGKGYFENTTDASEQILVLQWRTWYIVKQLHWTESDEWYKKKIYIEEKEEKDHEWLFHNAVYSHSEGK